MIDVTSDATPTQDSLRYCQGVYLLYAPRPEALVGGVCLDPLEHCWVDVVLFKLTVEHTHSSRIDSNMQSVFQHNATVTGVTGCMTCGACLQDITLQTPSHHNVIRFAVNLNSAVLLAGLKQCAADAPTNRGYRYSHEATDKPRGHQHLLAGAPVAVHHLPTLWILFLCRLDTQQDADRLQDHDHTCRQYSPHIKTEVASGKIASEHKTGC